MCVFTGKTHNLEFMFGAMDSIAKAASLLLALDIGSRFRRATPDWKLGEAAEPTAATIRELYGDAGYWPTPWLGGFLGGHLQTVWYGLNPISPTYSFKEVTWITGDGGTIGLAYPDVPASLPKDAPIILILPGLCGSIKGTGHTVRAILDAGCRPVCFHSRGCGNDLSSPCFNIFGSTDDLREAVGRLSEEYEDSPLCLYSISAGTALMVRYLGEEGEHAPITAAVANCPGYDIGVCMGRVSVLYDSSFYIGVLKKHWLDGANGRMLRAASPVLYDRMATAPDMHSFMVAAAPFADPHFASECAASSSRTADAPVDAGSIANGFARFLARTNPMGVAHQIQIPALILNADDDPICSPKNTDENLPALMDIPGSCPKTVALRFKQGGHCCFASGWRARRWADDLSAGFLAAVSARANSLAKPTYDDIGG